MADSPAGEWGTLSLTPPTAALNDILAPINSVADFIIAVLDIALLALNLVKTILRSYLDPVVSLVQAIVDELLALARSLEGIGIYFAGDWDLLSYPFEDLKGGFANYERRMIARLTDRTDPTRPDVSSSIQTFAGFLYLSVDGAEIHRLLALMSQLERLFNVSFKPKSPLPTPTITNVIYGSDATSILNFDSLVNLVRFDPTPPSIARISWKVNPPTTENPLKPFPPLPPKYYLITVSTIPDGIKLYYDRPRSDTDTKAAQDGKKAQPREYGPVLDRRGVPVVLYGGAQMLAFDKATFGWDSSVDSNGNVLAGRARVYGVMDAANNSIIPLEHLVYDQPVTQSGGGTAFQSTVLWQKTFTVDPIETSLQWATDEFTFDLNLDDLPYHATVEMVNGKTQIKGIHRPSTYYVRVATTGPSSINSDAEFESLRNRFIYNLESQAAKENATASGQPFIVNVGKEEDAGQAFVLSEWSEPKTLTFSNASTRDYLDAVRAALAVLVLCRVDLTVIDELADLVEAGVLEAAKDGKRMLPDVALKATNLEQYRHLLDFVYPDFTRAVKAKGGTPAAFRKDLLDRVTQLATDLYQTTGPMPAAEAAVVAATETLRSVKWSEILADRRGATNQFVQDLNGTNDMTLLQSLGEVGPDGTTGGATEDRGLALNPYGIGVSDIRMSDLFLFFSGSDILFRDRSPHFIELGVAGGAFSDEWKLLKHVPAAEVPAFLEGLPSGLQMLYEHYIADKDKVETDTKGNKIIRYKKGDIAVEQEAADFFTALQNLKQIKGSADLSPVFYQRRSFFDSDTAAQAGNLDIAYCRTLLAEYKNGQLMQEAAIALGVAAAAHQRSPSDGAWLSVRLGDVFPALDAFFDSIINWVESIQASIKSVADTLVSYIEYVEGWIIELQQLIRRINSMLQMAFSFSLSIPKVSGLFLASNGTDGVLSDFANAENKPQDSPLAYGAGVVLVAPAFPAFIADLFRVTDDPATGTLGSPGAIPPVFGIEGLSEEALYPPSDPEPDVL